MTDLVISDYTQAECIGECLAVRFQEIAETRMQDVPIINAVLQTQAVGFRTWQGYAFGVLITPWFMNLVILQDAKLEATRKVGSKTTYQFPSGSYEFIIAYEPSLGEYEMCSLFSPMDAFADQDAAEATATEVMQALLDPDHQEQLGSEPLEKTEEPAQEKDAQPMSRRELFRLSLGGDQ